MRVVTYRNDRKGRDRKGPPGDRTYGKRDAYSLLLYTPLKLWARESTSRSLPHMSIGIGEVRSHGEHDVIATCHVGKEAGLLDKLVHALGDIVLGQAGAVHDGGVRARPVLKVETIWGTVVPCPAKLLAVKMKPSAGL
jgi:hypothetical protein